MLRNHTTNREPIVPIIVVLRVHITTIEVQIVGIVRITRVKGTRPIVTISTPIVKTSTITVTTSRNNQLSSIRIKKGTLPQHMCCLYEPLVIALFFCNLYRQITYEITLY